MALKDKAWQVALVGGILTLIGWITPFRWASIGVYTSMTWSWGLAYDTYIGIIFAAQISVAGILIIISAIITLITSYLSKKRENLKLMAILWLVSGILAIIGIFVLIGMGAMTYLSFGFYLPLFGGIIVTVAGAMGLSR
ncbi:MAG: hypothetical protein ACFE9X_02180 [Promethearchaeota archaeon]